jgi:hypothetical protein
MTVAEPPVANALVRSQRRLLDMTVTIVTSGLVLLCMIAVKRMIRKGAPCLSSFSRSSSPRQWCFVCSPSPPTRVANRKSRPGGHRTAHFRNCRLGGRFHRCDFGEADRMRSFRPLIGRYAGDGRSARLSIDYSLEFYRQRQDKIRVNRARFKR